MILTISLISVQAVLPFFEQEDIIRHAAMRGTVIDKLEFAEKWVHKINQNKDGNKHSNLPYQKTLESLHKRERDEILYRFKRLTQILY